RVLPDSRDFYESLNTKNHVGLRVNRLKTSPEYFKQLISCEENPVNWCSDGLYYTDAGISKSLYHKMGLFYMQEPSAMLPVKLLDVKQGERVMDLCSAPGGKSTQIGEALYGSGLLVSNDISPSRSQAVVKNLERGGILNACVLSETADKLVNVFGNYFDKILVDAPCSGEGMFRRDDKAVSSWINKGPDYYAPIQRELLKNAALMLKPGGYLVYSTCTFNEYENEKIVGEFLENNRDFSCVNINHELLGVSKGVNGESFCARVWPHRHRGEGHFAALIKKNETGNFERPLITQSMNGHKKLFQPFYDFCNEILDTELDCLLDTHGDSLFFVPSDLPDLKGIRVIRSGGLLGSLKSGRFEPSFGLAMFLKADMCKNVYDFGDDLTLAEKYFKGESFDISLKKGWYLGVYKGFPLGFLKSDGVRLKNKLPINRIE
ncbi:MAG: RsmB/NOP family class I SAM-dependent RNA methyltransferase, partial [Clostridiales bacterium]|nr:RsmB/NOP family class I SAM-dependent RNA methyltransferase [Clostridiales bacterium]